MTTSNHRPYTYPPGRIDIPSGTGREGAVKYTDHAIGHLLQGRAGATVKDTVFVITADHGASATGSSHIPVDRYRIPVSCTRPRTCRRRRVDR